MPSQLAYSDIYSSFFSKVQAYDFLDLTETQVSEFLCSWLHSSISKPYIRRLFSKNNGIKLDDEIQIITYDMDYVIDDEYDREFLTDVLSYGLLIEWLNPKVLNLQNLTQVFASSEEKFYSQSNHLSQLQELLAESQRRQRRIISDRGYYYNNYLDNE